MEPTKPTKRELILMGIIIAYMIVLLVGVYQ